MRSRIDEEPSGRFLCGDAHENVSVDLSASSAPHPDLRVGDTVRVTGVAILDIDNCRPSAAFPQARGYVVVPTSSDGLAVVARARHPLPPSAWYVLGALLASILGVGIWNRSLRRLAQMRGKDLAREEIARAEADLRTGERMRIAADLHDALSQSLTGVALEVEAALRTDRRNDAARAAHLARAGATLASCREELRNCLWDLRSAAMDEADMNEAVRRTLLPHIRGIALSVRFNVSRRRLSDFTVHTLLCIIRELAVNAIRHGGATRRRPGAHLRTRRRMRLRPRDRAGRHGEPLRPARRARTHQQPRRRLYARPQAKRRHARHRRTGRAAGEGGNMKKISILLVDDHAIVRMGLASLFATTDDLAVAGSVGDGPSALREADRLHPDVILLDFLMPGMNGLEVTNALLAADPSRKVLILTTFGEAEGIRRALAAGARGAVLKSIPFDDLVAAVRTVAGGGTHVSPEIRQIIEEEKPLSALSPRQREILQSVSHGLTNEAIAANLGISVPMVRQHLQALFAKIGAQNRAEAVAIALRRMLLKI